MPELPELLHLCSQLQTAIIGKSYENHVVNNVRVVKKEIFIDLDNHTSIKIHLMLTGRLSIYKSNITRHTFSFKKDSSILNIYLNDQRNFAKFDIVKTNITQQISMENILLTNRTKMFHRALRLLPGIGNYLVSEICGELNVYPLTKVENVKLEMSHIIGVINRLIHDITLLGGSHKYTDLYDHNGRYIPKYYKNPDMFVINSGTQRIYTRIKDPTIRKTSSVVTRSKSRGILKPINIKP